MEGPVEYQAARGTRELALLPRQAACQNANQTENPHRVHLGGPTVPLPAVMVVGADGVAALPLDRVAAYAAPPAAAAPTAARIAISLMDIPPAAAPAAP